MTNSTEPTKRELPKVWPAAEIPPGLLEALSRVRGNYSSLPHLFHCIRSYDGRYVGVAGDADNGAYEHFTWQRGKLTISDVGYGSTEIALRDVLLLERPIPAKRKEAA